MPQIRCGHGLPAASPNSCFRKLGSFLQVSKQKSPTKWSLDQAPEFWKNSAGGGLTWSCEELSGTEEPLVEVQHSGALEGLSSGYLHAYVRI